MKRLPIDQQRIRELFAYDPDAGVFTRKICTAPQRKVGEVAGSKDHAGYVTIVFDRKWYKAHRMAWVYLNGDIPEGFEIDHANGIRDDNRIENLRLATRSQNAQNQKRPHRDSATEKRGVTLHKRTGKFAAQIFVDGKNHHLGLFDDVDSAAEARVTAEREIRPFSPLNL